MTLLSLYCYLGVMQVVHYHVYGYPRADSCPIRQSWTFKFQRKLLQVQLLEMYLVYLQVQGMSGDANSLTNVKTFHRLSFSVVGGHIISSSKATSR
jgi:hypothetical protein